LLLLCVALQANQMTSARSPHEALANKLLGHAPAATSSNHEIEFAHIRADSFAQSPQRAWTDDDPAVYTTQISNFGQNIRCLVCWTSFFELAGVPSHRPAASANRFVLHVGDGWRVVWLAGWLAAWLAGWMDGWMTGPRPRSFFPHLFLLFWLLESIQRMGGDSPSHKGRVHKRKAQTHSSVANECSAADHAHQQSAHLLPLDALEPISSRHREINRV
jgi:hypothetical protein